VPDLRDAGRPVRVLELRSVRGTGGGPEKTILASAALADRSRYEITVCYIRDRRDDVFSIDDQAAASGVDYVEIHERHSLDRAIWPDLKRLVAARQIDIVHAHEYKTDLLALLLARSVGVIPLATAHGWTGHSWRERRVYYPMDRRVLARFPVAIAVSEQIRRTLIESGARPERVTTILNGIDHRRFRRDPDRVPAARAWLGAHEGDIVIGGVGRLEPQKRFDLLIEVAAALQTDHPRLRLVIAGDGSLRGALEHLAGQRLRAGTWTLLGHCDDVAALHHGLDLFVQTSDYEGTPNAVLEAMAFETPVVATAAGGTDELVSDGSTARVIAPGDTVAIRQAIEEVLSDPESARGRALAARRRVEDELSFERRARKVEAIYDALVTRFGHRSPADQAVQWA